MTTPDPDFARTIDSDVVRKLTASKPERLLSLDVLRGLTIAFMILVNDQTGPARGESVLLQGFVTPYLFSMRRGGERSLVL